MTKRIALIGNPNCGKTTLFNRLTGLDQKTSNLPGTTVDSYKGKIKLNGEVVELIDLPGIYSLFTNSEYEHVVIRQLLAEGEEKIDGVIYILDASNLRRNLLLLSQVSELEIPATCVLTMNDTAARRQISVDYSKLSEEIGLNITPFNPRTDKNLSPIHNAVSELKVGLKLSFNAGFRERLSDFADGKIDRGISKETLLRYGSIDGVIQRAVSTKDKKKASNTLKIDRIVTHPIYGFFIFIFVMLALFQGVFTLAEKPMEWIENGFAFLRDQISTVLPGGTMGNFVQNGLLSGLEGVVLFVPQIFILFFLIGILEDSGYMVRASFISDRIMRKLGLNGRSIIPLVGGFACAIPSIMATRTIRNKSERLITMLIVPLMSCSARLPVYILLISLIVPGNEFWGPLPAQTLLMTLAYFAGIFMAVIVALGLKIFGKNRENSEFVLELPTYHPPRIQTVMSQAWIKCKAFLNEAGKIIVIISMVLWALSSFGPEKAMQEAHLKATELSQQNNPDSTQIAQSLLLEASYAGHLGKWIEPAISPLGYDWKTGIALISSFAAREVFVGTMSTLFQSNSDDEDVMGIRDKMQSQINPATGKPLYGIPYAVSLMLFYAFALQCVSTMAVLKKETHSWKWPILLFVGYGFIAYVSAWIAYNLLS